MPRENPILKALEDDKKRLLAEQTGIAIQLRQVEENLKRFQQLIRRKKKPEPVAAVAE